MGHVHTAPPLRFRQVGMPFLSPRAKLPKAPAGFPGSHVWARKFSQVSESCRVRETPPSVQNRALAVARGSVSARHAEVPRSRGSSGSSEHHPGRVCGVGRAGRGGARAGSTRGGGGSGLGLTPRGPRARAPRPVGSCRRPLADSQRRGSGAARRGPRWPGRPHAASAGPREGPGGRRRAPSGKPLRSGAPAPLPSTSCIGAFGAFRKRLALVVKVCFFFFFFCQKPFGSGSRPGALLRHTETRRPRPRGRAWRRAVPGGGARRGRPTESSASAARAGSAAGELEGNSGERLQLGEESRGKEGAPCCWPLALRTRRWGGQELCAGHSHSTGSHGLASRPQEPPRSPAGSPRSETELLPLISDRWPRRLLLDASTDDELTILQGGLNPRQARNLTCWCCSHTWMGPEGESQSATPGRREASILGALSLKNVS